MTQYRTGNPLGSMQPRDMFDNAQNVDNWSNGSEPFYEDRFGVMRRSFSGMNFEFEAGQDGRNAAFDQSQADKESRFQAFLVSSSYVSKGDYAANVVLEERNEYVAVDAATTGTTAGLYRPNAEAVLPLTLTGTWATDSASLVLLGDDVLRQDLANGNGELVGYRSPLAAAVARNIRLKLAELVSVKDFGAVGDGVADDTAAVQACIDAVGALMDGVVFFPTGKYRITTSLNLTNGKVSLKGSSSNRDDSVIIGDTGEDFAIDMTGSDNRWTSIEDLYLVSDASQANPTVNGLLLARTVSASLAGESYFKNFRINLISAPTANNGYGSVGVASIGSESNKFSQLFVAADVPFYSNAAPELIEFSAGAKVVVKNITSIYKTIDPAGASNTENQVDGILLSRSTNLARSALFINSGASWHMNVFISRLSAPSESVTSFATAITLSNCNSMHIEGDVEGFKVPLAVIGFNKSHGVKLYTSFSDGYPLVYSKSSITGTINTLDDCDVDIHPTYASRNVAATFIKSQNVIQIGGGEIKLHCDLNITDVSSNWLRGVLIKNRGGKTITTNNEQNLSLASSYSEVSPSGLRLFGPDTLINSGFGFNEKTSNYFINTLVDGSVNTRTSREFSTGLSGNNVFVVVKINGEGANAVPFYIERLFMFRRVGTGVAYALHHSETLKNIDPDNVAPTLTTVPTVTSALGAALSFTLAFTIASGGASIGNIAGSCVASGKHP